MKTHTVKKSEWKNQPMLEIYKVLGVTSEGQEITPERPLIKFGKNKAKDLSEAFKALEEEITTFIE